MASYRTNKETQAAIESIITNADKQLILVSPYIKLTNTWLARIKACAERGVKVKIIHRAGELKSDELSLLHTIKNVEIKSTNNLHAKCYFNEQEMIITSFNLLESSEKNWEMGILVNKNEDKVIFDNAMRDVLIIFNDSNSHSLTSVQNHYQQKLQHKVVARKNINEGFCIRCDDNIKFDVEKPLCRECYEEWSEWEDDEYPESYCHFSGEDSDGETSFAKPILKKNWKKAKEVFAL